MSDVVDVCFNSLLLYLYHLRVEYFTSLPLTRLSVSRPHILIATWSYAFQRARNGHYPMVLIRLPPWRLHLLQHRSSYLSKAPTSFSPSFAMATYKGSLSPPPAPIVIIAVPLSTKRSIQRHPHITDHHTQGQMF
jgi:hypothetical protein